MSRELSANTTVSHYRIVSKIGVGGMGEVYLAQDTKLDRKVALKVLPADVAANHDRMERFVREAKSAAALNHPHIAQIHEIGEHQGTHFIVMELVDGVTLRETIHCEGTELNKLLRLLQQVAEGLSKAHAAGIVHRDLKPDNIMITRDGFAKVLDFGLAKLVESGTGFGQSDDSNVATQVMKQHSAPGVVMGTVGYMSPEQAQGKSQDIDQRSDIFSFGCILFEAVTGRRAFAGQDPIDTLNKVIREPVPPISDFRPDAPNHLQRIVRRCLAKDREDRYQTIKDVAIELRELRRELERTGVDTTAPQSRSGTTREPVAQTGSSGAQTGSAVGSTTAPVSSAEYIVSGIKKHKLAVTITAILLVAGAIGANFYLHARNTEVAIESIAVLPFLNRSADADSEYLSDGLAESLIYRLSQLPKLRVSPTSSVFRYKGKDADAQTIGNELGVNAVMTGRIAKRGENLTISVELVDVRNNKTLWGEQYERKLSELLATQREIATEITNKLQLKLSGTDEAKVAKNYTANPEAYQFYLKGRYYWNKRDAENLRKAIEQFKAAADKDPNYALAYAGLADCYIVSPYYGGARSSELVHQAKAYAIRAVEIDDQLAEAHTSLAYVRQGLWDWAGAEKEYQRAIELNPNYPTAQFWYARFQLRVLGRSEEGLMRLRRAHELEPLSLVIYDNLAQIYLAQGDVNAAFEQARRMIELDPNYAAGHFFLSQVYVKKGQTIEAQAEAEKCLELTKQSARFFSNLGFIRAVSGKRSEALTLVKELEDKYAKQQADATHIAVIYAGLREKDQAFAWLEKAFQDRSSLLVDLRVEFPFASLHEDSRFTDLLKRMGMSEQI